MSVEFREFVSSYAQQEIAKLAVIKTDNKYVAKKEQFYPKGGGTSINKGRAAIGVWRK